MKKIILATLVVAVSSTSAFAASGNTSTATGVASATIVSPLVVTHDSAAVLNFGKFTVGTGGTVSVDAAGSASVTSDVGFVPGSTSSADAFSVTGDASRSFAITTTGGSVTGPGTMNFTTTASASSGLLSASGVASFKVGGTLNVPATATAGVYTGTYSATVTYN